MTFLQAAMRAVRVAREYTDATDDLLLELEAGKSLREALMTFAQATANALDDEVINLLLWGFDTSIDTASDLAKLATDVSETIAQLGADSLSLERRLRNLID
jgi:hypothetical protein